VLLLILLWTVGFAAVLGVGLLLFVAVERPCITWAKRVPSSRAPVPAPVDEAPGAAEASATDIAADGDAGDAPRPAGGDRPPSA
jgi:peptidoglycan/LPS O-acetylase OafA/YrhL